MVDDRGMEEYATEVAQHCKSRNAPCGGCMQGGLCDNFDGIEDDSYPRGDDEEEDDGYNIVAPGDFLL